MRFLTILFLSALILTELWYVKKQFFFSKQEPENTILLRQFKETLVENETVPFQFGYFVTWSGAGNKIIVNLDLPHSF